MAAGTVLASTTAANNSWKCVWYLFRPLKGFAEMPLLDLSQEQFSHLGRIVRGPIPHQISNSPFNNFQSHKDCHNMNTIWISQYVLTICISQYVTFCISVFFCNSFNPSSPDGTPRPLSAFSSQTIWTMGGSQTRSIWHVGIAGRILAPLWQQSSQVTEVTEIWIL